MSFNTPAKIAIRQDWGKPILRFLSEKINSKLIYMGLPSPDAEDIKAWIDYLKYVYAFQCREYPHPSDPNQSTDAVDKLEEYLRSIETAEKIDGFTLYQGYIEEVVLQKEDLTGQSFIQDNFVTVYNLDFCNQITFPFDVIDEHGEIKPVYKFDTIDELLNIQSKLDILPDKFVLFLTVHCSYDDSKINQYLSNVQDLALRQLHHNFRTMGGIKTKSRLLKSFVYHHLANLFEQYGFTIQFLPTIFYNGLNNHRLLHFSVIGQQVNPANPLIALNSLTNFIKQKLLSIENGSFVNLSISDIEIDVEVNPEEHLIQSPIFEGI